MQTPGFRRASALLALSLLLAGGSAHSAALTGFTDLVAYESSSGELPTAQGWSFFTDDPLPDDDLDASNYFLAAGLLVQGSTGGVSADPANRQWIAPPAFDYDVDSDVVILDLRVRILESTSVEPPTSNARAGFGVLFADRDGQQILFYVSENGIFLVGASDQTSSLHLNAPTGSLRDYRIRIDALGASVVENGFTRISLPRTTFFQTALSNELRIGDIQPLERSSVEIESIRFGRASPSEPGVREHEWVTGLDVGGPQPVRTLTLDCPPGKFVISGGFTATPDARVVVQDSHPTGAQPYTQWFVRAEQLLPEGGDWGIAGHVICGEIPGQEFVQVQTAGGLEDTSITASCPASKIAVATGFQTDQPPDEIPVVFTSDFEFPLGQTVVASGWEVLQTLAESLDWDIAAYATCSDVQDWVVVNANLASSSSSPKTVDAICPEGMVAIGGGARPSIAEPEALKLLSSRPIAVNGPGPDGWRVSVEERGQNAASWGLTVNAICGWPADVTVSRRALLGRWRADSGTPADDLGRNDGILQNGASIEPGLLDQAFQFDRVNDEWLEIPGEDFYFDRSFTVDAWIQTDSLAPGEEAAIATLYDIGGTNPLVSNASWSLRLTPDGRPWGLVRPGTTPTMNSIVEGTTPIADGGIHHLALVRDLDPSVSDHILYVDGVPVDTDPVVTGEDGPLYPGDPADPDPVSVGAYRAAASADINRAFEGLIDDLKFYDRALSQDEIQNIYGCERALLPRVLNLDAGNYGATAAADDGHRLCVFLPAGDYTITLVSPADEPTALFQAWSPGVGQEWVTAWSAAGELDPGTSGGSSVGEASAEAAFDGTTPKSIVLTVPQDQRFYFSVVDAPPVLDNLGGVSLSIAAPEPGFGLALGLAGLELLRRARRRSIRASVRRDRAGARTRTGSPSSNR